MPLYLKTPIMQTMTLPDDWRECRTAQEIAYWIIAKFEDLGLNEIVEDVAALKTTVAGHTASITTLTNNLLSLVQRVNEDEENVEHINDALVALAGRVGVNEDDITTLYGRIDAADGEIDAVNARVESVEDDIADMGERLTGDETTIEQHGERLTTVENSVDDLELTVGGHTELLSKYTPYQIGNTGTYPENKRVVYGNVIKTQGGITPPAIAQAVVGDVYTYIMFNETNADQVIEFLNCKDTDGNGKVPLESAIVVAGCARRFHFWKSTSTATLYDWSCE